MNRGQLRLGVLAVVVSSWTAAGVQGADTYKVDTGHSTVLFRVKHLNVTNFYGRFNEATGKITVDESDPTKTAFEVEVKTDSVDTADKKRDGHLKSPDFFNAREFPTMTFKSKQVKAAGEGKLEVTGDLTAHGVTKEIKVTMERTGMGPDPWGGHRIGFETMFEIKRSDYGMDHMLNGLSDDVRLTIALEGVRE